LEENIESLVVDKQDISKSLDTRTTALDKQIDILDQKILQLQSHILTVETANSKMEHMAQNEKDPVKRSKIYAAMRYNIELLVKLYSVIKEYEDVKFRYNKEINEVVYNKYHLVAIELRKIEKNIDSTGSGVMGMYEKLTELMGNRDRMRKIEEELNSDPEYRL
jgi:hypothetical protein